MKLSHTLTIGLSAFILVGASMFFEPNQIDRVDAGPEVYQMVLNGTNQPTASSGTYAELSIPEKYVEVWYVAYEALTTVPGIHVGFNSEGGTFYNHTPVHGIQSIRVDWTSTNPSAKIGVYFGTTSASVDGGGYEPALSGVTYTSSGVYDFFYIATYYDISFTTITINYSCI